MLCVIDKDKVFEKFSLEMRSVFSNEELSSKMLRKPFAASIFSDFSLEKWRLPKRRVAQIS